MQKKPTGEFGGALYEMWRRWKSEVSFWMLFQLLARVGRAPVDKKVFFGQSESFGVSFIFSSGFWFIFSMSRYVPVSTKMDSEDHYHSPYDTNELDSDVSFSPRNFMKYHICVFLFAYVFVFVHKKNNFILKTQAHYEAPSCLKRNPSGSLFIPSGK